MSHSRAPSRTARRIGWLPLGALAALLLAAIGVAADWWIAVPVETRAEFVGRKRCAECHAAEAEKWAGSHHDLAMDLATPDKVLGDFANQAFEHQGITSTMSREGDRFFVTTDGAKGNLEKFEVKYTFGVRPLQQYLVETQPADKGIGRVQCLPIAWEPDQKRWFHLYPDEKLPPSDPLHWTQPAQNWNYMCAECHSTGLKKNYELTDRNYHTTYHEIDVSCEACHGPGSLHVQLAEAKSLFWDRHHGYGLARLKSKDSRVELEACARCHARRNVVMDGFEPGQPFLDHYLPELLDSAVYHVDGQIRDEAYEYGSFLQSRMYRENVRCTDCHDPHTSRLRAEGNNLCNRCHTPGKYDTPTHHHHPVGKAGSSCVDCHMPETTYMIVDPRRDHSIRVPRPDLTLELKTPNACNGCHTKPNEDAKWASARIVEWFGPKRVGDPHYAHAIAAGRAGKADAPAKLAQVARRTEVGPLVRASAVALLGRFATLESQEAITLALDDSEPLVRAAAAGAAQALPEGRRIELLAPRLNDPIRAVRLEATRWIAASGADQLPSDVRPRFEAGLEEFKRGQLSNSEQPAAHLNLGVVYSGIGRTNEALAAYRLALSLDPGFVPALANIALLYHELGRNSEAEKIYRELIERQPDLADAHYSLALLLAEDSSRLAEAAQQLAEAVRLAPDNARMRYNLGLAQQQLGRIGPAGESLLKAHELEPGNVDYVYALAILHLREGDWEQARRFAGELAKLRPQDGAALLDEIARQERTPRPAGPAAR